MAMKEDDFSGDEVDRRVEVIEMPASPDEEWEEDPDDTTRLLAMQARHASNEAARRRKRSGWVILGALLLFVFAWGC